MFLQDQFDHFKFNKTTPAIIQERDYSSGKPPILPQEFPSLDGA